MTTHMIPTIAIELTTSGGVRSSTSMVLWSGGVFQMIFRRPDVMIVNQVLYNRKKACVTFDGDFRV